MKKVLLSATIALSVLFTACNSDKKTKAAIDSAAAADPANAPVIKFEKNAYDFGKISSGEKVTYNFKFENTGKSPLIISNATASCGCTVPEFPHEPIPPGGKGEVKVIFNSQGKSGMQHKVVTVTSNTVPPAVEIYLTGEVEGETTAATSKKK